jgi:hypothetical protein
MAGRWRRDEESGDDSDVSCSELEDDEWSGSDGREERATLRLQCSDTAKGGCRSVVEVHDEAVMRAVLDSDIEGKPDTGVCVQLLPGCEAKRADFHVWRKREQPGDGGMGDVGVGNDGGEQRIGAVLHDLF